MVQKIFRVETVLDDTKQWVLYMLILNHGRDTIVKSCCTRQTFCVPDGSSALMKGTGNGGDLERMRTGGMGASLYHPISFPLDLKTSLLQKNSKNR